MKKRILAFFVIMLIVSMSFTGCGGSNEASEEKGDAVGTFEEQADEPVQEISETSDEDYGAESVVYEEQDSDKPAPQLVLMKKNFYESTDEEPYAELLEGSFEGPLLNDESALLYPELAASLAADTADGLREFETQEEEYLEMAKEQYSYNDGEVFYGFYTDNKKVYLRRADDKIVSFFYPWDCYLGGAHGSYGNDCATYDTATGKKLELSEVITDEYDLRKLARIKLETTYADSLDMFYDLESGLSRYVTDPSEVVEYDLESGNDDYTYLYTWALTDEGLELYFGTYSLAPYASGAQTAVLGYDEYPGLIKKEFIPDHKQDAHMYYMAEYSDIYDVDDDGEADFIGVDRMYNDEYTEIVNLECFVNNYRLALGEDGEYSYITNAENIDCYYIETAGGGGFMYIVIPTLGDYFELDIIDVGGKTPELVNKQYYPSMTIGYDEDGTSTSYFLYDPENMMLGERFYQICTYTGFKSYHVGDDGLPQTDDEVYNIKMTTEWEPITCVQDFEADFFENGEAVGTETVHSGETFELISTDGSSWIDARISDGRIVRLYTEGDGMDVIVNGIRGEELFANLMYAG